MPPINIASGRKGPPRPPKAEGPKPAKMAPPQAPGADEPPPVGEGETKASREKALVVLAAHHCGQCENYQAESGECSKVEGSFDPDDACLRYFTPISEGEQEEPESQEPANEQPPDYDDAA